VGKKRERCIKGGCFCQQRGSEEKEERTACLFECTVNSGGCLIGFVISKRSRRGIIIIMIIIIMIIIIE